MKPFQIVFFACMGFFISCKKFVEIDPPVTKLSATDVFDNSDIATGAQLGIYADMFTNVSGSLLSPDLAIMADELTNYSQEQNVYYRNGYTALTYGGREWPALYYEIYQANAVLEGLSASTGITDPVKKQLSGEAYFVRSFCHFYLTNLFGDVPLIVTTDYKINGLLPRSSSQIVYDQIISDLRQAEKSLNIDYIDGSDTSVTTDRIRPNSAVASALLARVYLYRGKYDSAAAEATKLISNPAYSLEPNLANVFLSNSSEAIWQLATPTPNTFDTQDGQIFFLFSAPRNNSVGNCYTVSPQLMAAFEPNDLRRISWIDSVIVSSPGDTFYFPYKYRVYDNSTNPNNRTEYEMVFRLSEQYLIRSEARAYTGDLPGAASDLNVIRRRAGLLNIADSIATSQPALLSAILHERQVELFTEWGHRWLDLKRTGTINAVMSTVTPRKMGVWNPGGYQQLLPIPLDEINKDHNLSQNIGY